MGSKSDWAVAGIEPSLEEVMSDPITSALALLRAAQGSELRPRGLQLRLV